MATVKLSPPLLQERRTALAANMGARIIGASKTKAPTLPVSHRQRPAAKRKATIDAAGEPAARRPATEPLSQSASTDASTQRLGLQPSTSRGSTTATGGLAYAAVVAGRAIPHPSSGPLKPTAKGSAHADPAASTEAALRRNSSELPGPLSGMPAGATFPQAPEVNVVPAGQRRNSRDVSFHTFSLPEDRSERLLVKNLGKPMPESVVQEELAAQCISAQGVMQLRSGRRCQDGTQDRP
jgi:hypothetical protein